MINYGKQSIDKKDTFAVINTLKKKLITQGPEVKKFEDSIKKKFGSKYCASVSSGTAALHLTGLALNWRKGDIILCSTLTFLATSNSIIYCGAKPELIDIDPSNYSININQLENKLNFYKKKVKAVIITDYAGNPSNWKKIKQLSKKFKFKTINDNCHALGASYQGNKKYAVKFADVVTHSYHPVKSITTGEGGAVLTNNKKIYEKVKLLRSHGIVRSKKINKNKPWYYEMKYLGFNYRITDFQCALGNSQLKKLNIFIKKRQKIAKVYNHKFSNLGIFKLPYVDKNNLHSYHLYPLCIDFKKIKLSKSMLFNLLKKKNVNLQVHYIPIHRHPYYKNNFKFKKRNFPEAEKFYREEVSLPIYFDLTIKKANEIADEIIKICDKR